MTTSIMNPEVTQRQVSLCWLLRLRETGVRGSATPIAPTSRCGPPEGPRVGPASVLMLNLISPILLRRLRARRWVQLLR